MGKKVRISDESVNCYGTRILTSGIDLAQYERNPVLLHMHQRGTVVGLVKNLQVKDGELLGELEFDCASPLSQQLKKQYEFGSMKMVSANFLVLETSDDKALLQPGQTAETVTRSRLFEVSAVDIGGNDNAIVLSSPEGNQLPLAAGEPQAHPCLPLIDNNPISKTLKTEREMETKQVALMLGLSETADESAIAAKANELKLAAAKVSALQQQVADLQSQQEQIALAAVTQVVDAAVKEKRIAEQMKPHFVELGKKMGVESLRLTLNAIQPQGKITEVLRTTNGRVQLANPQQGQYMKLSDVPANQVWDMRENQRDEYIRLYRAEYGVEPSFDE